LSQIVVLSFQNLVLLLHRIKPQARLLVFLVVDLLQVS
jgi:hypothetical protein